ncbi:hypothetical protein HDV00_001328 [Rhizophlyctis rosea]|nr:hypothetical protein HDV00_001328 [Rhizophlyctis rosea]
MRSIIAAICLALAATVSAQTAPQTPVSVPSACPDCNTVLIALQACPKVATPVDNAGWYAAANQIVPCVCTAITTPTGNTCGDCLVTQGFTDLTSSTADYNDMFKYCQTYGGNSDFAINAFLKKVGAKLTADNTTATGGNGAVSEVSPTTQPANIGSGAEAVGASALFAVVAGLMGVAASL